MEYYVPIFILTHFMVFILAAMFFAYDSKKSHKETLNENDNLRKEVDSLKVKIDNLLDAIVSMNNKTTNR